MGRIKGNVITQGFSGKYSDDLIFRHVDGQTFFVRKPEITAPPSERQLEARNKFSEASFFATTAIENSKASQEYKLMATAQGLKSAYLAAMTDYLTLPEISSVFTRSYKGAPGDAISITGKLAYKITGVDVTIIRADGTVLESGAAVARELKWRYSATVPNTQVPGSRLVLKSRDRQGKEFITEKLL